MTRLSADSDLKNDLTRRRFMARAAQTLLGVGLLPVLSERSWAGPAATQATTQSAARPPTAKNVIFLFMNGGMSHLDTFDPKPGRAVQGPTRVISTSVDGYQIGEHLPKLARQMHQAAVINSMASTQGAHEQGDYYLHTSYFLRGTIRHPSMGAWLNFLEPGGNPTLPGSVFVGDASRHPGAGFLPAKYAPLMMNNVENGLANVSMPQGMTDDRFVHRLGLSRELDAAFRERYPTRSVQAYTSMYDDAVGLMKSKDLAAFDLTQETAETRAMYGRGIFGQGCLLARRLVEHGVRFVEVALTGWDTHEANFVRVPDLCYTLDQALSALLIDLERVGRLKDTLVVLASEFGRTPEINVNAGRDHHPKAFSALLAGGGIKGGVRYGKTDEDGREIEEGEVKIPSLNATIAYALGLSLDKVTLSPSQRPFTVADKGKPVTSLFA